MFEQKSFNNHSYGKIAVSFYLDLVQDRGHFLRGMIHQ